MATQRRHRTVDRGAPGPVPAAGRSRAEHDADYARLLAGVQTTFDRAVATRRPLFRTSGKDLPGTFLAALPDEKQVHACATCRSFLSRFGSLVTLAEDGAASSALWDPSSVPAFYRPSVEALRAQVEGRQVTAVFRAEGEVWGTPASGGWEHLHVRVPRAYAHDDPVRTPGQVMATVREAGATVARALTLWTPATLRDAAALLDTGRLPMSARFIGPVRWLAELQSARSGARTPALRDNLLWRAVATAPEGYCHPASSVVGTLLDSIGGSLPLDVVEARFRAKVAPNVYMRPTAAPSAGNRDRAEALVAASPGLDRALERRFARVDEVPVVWAPAPAPQPAAAAGIFGHVPTRKEAATAPMLQLPEQVMTWAKFSTTVLGRAQALDYWIGPDSGNHSLQAFTTAAHADAPPILSWDRAEARNPLSLYGYFFKPGERPYGPNHLVSSWGLGSLTWVPVIGVALRPNMMGDPPAPHLGEGVVLLLEGARDSTIGQGNALFPMTLRGELHEVRATIEAYSRRAVLGDSGGPAACGAAVSPGATGNVILRATVDARPAVYRIDRWD